jgi:hypothetical protein
VTERGTRLCRPSEVVLKILPNPEIGRFVKEDGRWSCGRERDRDLTSYAGARLVS